ncbi:MAG: UpxY family transcription antiterminator [bacterium]
MTVNKNTTAASKTEHFWYALYTRPRFEKKVDKELRDLHIETFLPLKKVTKFWSDRKKVIKEPLFPSYVFVYANLKERLRAYQPRGVVRMVSFNGRPTRIPEDQISAVRRILESGYTPVLYPYLSIGDEVEIVSGALVGLKGFVIENRGKNHFIVSIDGICQSVAVNIDARHLKLISKRQLKETQRNYIL